MCKPRMVRATWDGFFSKKETTEVFEWSTGTMRWCSILLVSHSVHVHSSLPPQFRDEFSFHQFNVCLCVHSYWVSISILEPVWPDNAITTNAHHTVTFSRLSGRYWCSWDWAKKRIFCLFTWPPRVQIFIVTEKKWSPRNQDSLRSADWWFAQRHVSQPYLNRSEVVKSVFCTETDKYPGALCAYPIGLKCLSPEANILWISLVTAPNIVSQTQWDFLSWLTVAGDCDL